MDWHELIDAVNKLKTSWKYPVDFYKDSIEVSVGKVDFIFKKDLELFQEFSFHDEADYAHVVSEYCFRLKDYKQMFKAIKQITLLDLTLE